MTTDMMPAASIVDVDPMDKIHVKKEELEEDKVGKLRGLTQEEILLHAINRDDTGPCVHQEMMGGSTGISICPFSVFFRTTKN